MVSHITGKHVSNIFSLDHMYCISSNKRRIRINAGSCLNTGVSLLDKKCVEFQINAGVRSGPASNTACTRKELNCIICVKRSICQNMLLCVCRTIVFWSVRWRKTTLPLQNKCSRSAKEGHRCRGRRSPGKSARRPRICTAISKRCRSTVPSK